MTASSRDQKQNRTVGLFALTTLTIGNMVGVGVFTSLGYQVPLGSGFAILVLWVVGTAYALCGALCYAELSATFPRSGGEYRLLSEVFHPAVGFLSGWVSATVAFSAASALAAMAMASYLQSWVPFDSRWVGGGALVLAAMIHGLNLKWSARFQAALTIFKVALVLGLTIFLFCHQGRGDLSFLPSGVNDWQVIWSSGFAVSMVYVTYSFSGWNAPSYIAGEVKRPQQTIFRAIALSTLFVGALYLGANASFLFAAPSRDLEFREQVALIALESVAGEGAAKWGALLIGVGLISILAAMTWVGPRVAQSIGSDLSALGFLAKTTDGGIPLRALILQLVLSLVMFCFVDFNSVLLAMEWMLVVFLALTVSGLFVSRWRFPNLQKPFRVPLYPLPPILFLLLSGWILWYLGCEKPEESSFGARFVMLGWVVWLSLDRGRPVVRV